MEQKNSLFARHPIIYRPYNLPTHFPVLTFFSENWTVTLDQPELLHFHNCFEIGFCLSGSGSICFEQYKLPFSAGQFSIINPLEPHISVCPEKNSNWEYVFFDPTVLFQGLSSTVPLYQNFYPSHYPSQIIDQKTSPDLYMILHQLFEELRGKQPFYPYAVYSLLQLTLAELNRLSTSSIAINQAKSQNYLSSDRKIQTVQTALLYIFDHYMENLTVASLSKLCCLSVSQFRKIFTEIIGISPLEYLQHYRIQHACRLLLQDRIQINEIARQTGYPTLSSFNRQFQQFIGCSPSFWKKKYLYQPEPHNINSLTDQENTSIFRY